MSRKKTFHEAFQFIVYLFISAVLLNYSDLYATEKNTNTHLAVERKNLLTIKQVIEKNKKEKLIFVGESHNSLSDHNLQLEVMQEMKNQGNNFVIGVEWFQRPFQKHLDDFIFGDLNEEKFLRRTEYFERWGFDYRYYRDILQYAKKNKIRILALNASQELTREVSAKGLVGLSSKTRLKLPSNYDFSNKEYRSRLRTVFDMHQHDGSTKTKEAFQRFLEVQLTWDETMAYEIAKFLKENDKQTILVFAGRGHTHREAIPDRVKKRIGIGGITIASYQQNDPFFSSDYVIVQPKMELPAVGLIGIEMEERENNIYIKSITRDILKKPFGLQINDQLLTISQINISKYSDVKLAMLNKEPGDKIIIEVLRLDKNGKERKIKKEILLIGETKNPH